MELVKVHHCVSAEPWWSVLIPSQTEKNKHYRVVIPWPSDPPEEFICECSGYVYRGHCRHLAIADESLCRWDEENDPPEKQTKPGVCPRCGRETITELEFV